MVTNMHMQFVNCQHLYKCVVLHVHVHVYTVYVYSQTLQYGDYDPDIYQPGFLSNETLLPKRVSFSIAACTYCMYSLHHADVHAWQDNLLLSLNVTISTLANVNSAVLCSCVEAAQMTRCNTIQYSAI